MNSNPIIQDTSGKINNEQGVIPPKNNVITHSRLHYSLALARTILLTPFTATAELTVRVFKLLTWDIGKAGTLKVLGYHNEAPAALLSSYLKTVRAARDLLFIPVFAYSLFWDIVGKKETFVDDLEVKPTTSYISIAHTKKFDQFSSYMHGRKTFEVTQPTGTNPNWHKTVQKPALKNENQAKRAAGELFSHATKQPIVRFVQLIRDTARLVLKVPFRAIATPIFLKKNWEERQRALVNAKLTGYAFVQLASVPAKFMVALIALATSALSQKGANWLLDQSEGWTAHLDGRTSQLEALKEEGAKKAKDRNEFDAYRTWLYSIDPKLCRKV